MHDDLDLADLFAAADAVGDKYLTPEEIAERDRKLADVRRDFWMTATDATLDAL